MKSRPSQPPFGIAAAADFVPEVILVDIGCPKEMQEVLRALEFFSKDAPYGGEHADID